jgi:hypothetical protein
LKLMSSAFLPNVRVMPWSPMTLPFVPRGSSSATWSGGADYLLTTCRPTATCRLRFVTLPLAGGGQLLAAGRRTSMRRRSPRFVRDAGVPLLGAVENMSGFVCPHRG